MKRVPVMIAAGCLCILFCGCVSVWATAEEPTSAFSEICVPTKESAWNPSADVPPETLVEYPIDPQVNPYTGLPKDENYPEGKRGVAVMVDNVRQAWPQSGLNQADLVYEVVCESGITRLMAVYRDYTAMPAVGPVRSARDQHIQLMLPLQTLYVHVGGSYRAADYLQRYHYTDMRSIDGKYKSFYWFDSTKDAEQSVYTNGEYMKQAVEEYGLQSQTSYDPPPVFHFTAQQEPRVLQGGEAKTVQIRFSGYAQTLLQYDETNKKYLKWEYDQPQIDQADEGRQYGADNVFVLFVPIDKYPDGVLANVHFDSQQGAGLYLNGGRFERVRWIKKDPASLLRIVDNQGNEIDVRVNPGTSYIAVVGTDQIENCWLDGKSLEEAFGENA